MKKTTVFVANITNAIPDHVIQGLVGNCGAVLKWNRAMGVLRKDQLARHR